MNIIEFNKPEPDADNIKVQPNGDFTMTWTAPYREHNITYTVNGIAVTPSTWVQLDLPLTTKGK